MAGAATGSGYGRQGFEADLPPATRRALLDLRRQIATATAAAASGGSGVPDGGTLDQVLGKLSATDGDVSWRDPAAGPAGPTGPIGPTGPKGDTGDTGPAGADGADGADAAVQPGEPNGFVNRDDCTLSWDDGTRTLTLTGTYDVWCDGTKYTKTGDSFVISDVEGAHFIYYDSTGTLAEISTFDLDLILNECLVAYVLWDATNSEAIPGAINEQHGSSMSPQTHSYLHNTIGAAYESGLSLAMSSVDGSGDDAVDAQFVGAIGEFRDEDIPHSVVAHGATDNIPVLYRDGAAGNWRMDDSGPYPVLKGVDRAYWNEWTGATWTRTEATNLDFVMAHIFAVPGVTPTTAKYVSVMGQGEYNTTSDARDAALSELLGLDLGGLPSPEFVPIGTIIFQSSTGYLNAVASRVRTTDDGQEYVDWRNNLVGSGSLVGPEGPAGPTGPQGAQGIQGEPGADGADGAGLGAYASFYLSTGGLTAAAGTALTLVLNQTDVNSDGTKYSLASNEVTVTDAGDYEISYHVSFNSGGTSRSEYNVWVEADTVEIPGTRSANYQRGYDSGSTSAATFITTLAASDVLRLRVQRTDGAATTGYQDDNGTRLTIKKLG